MAQHPFLFWPRSLLLAAACIFATAAAAQGEEPVETVTMVQDAGYPPYMMQTVSGPQGIYADIIREADRRMPGYEIDLRALPWPRALHLVSTGRVQALLGTYYRPTTRPWLREYSAALLYESVFVFCRKGVAQKGWTYPDDFSGLVFGNNSGFSTPGSAFFDMVARGEIFLNEEQTTDLNLKLLHLGRADCYVQDKSVVDPILDQGQYDRIEPVKQLTYEAAFVGLAETWAPAAADRFKMELDRVLKDMRQDGTVDRIVFSNIMD
ncbi:ABC transporter substrate-binding protein [Labrenzia sp. VG12]|uniref:substrate-binding periplasmic protein n=1 Tax=Labrenzia sp. VG12 TaxID=2021862 RepID=UPI0012FE340F|nr:transporter substrate-binding domain-containing protein [Labrenzia sp. VG12]